MTDDTRATPIARLFEPRTIAVIGANRQRGRIGSEVLHNLIAGGFTGRLFVVHPSAATVDGLTAYPSVQDLPDPIDLGVVCVPAPQVNGVAADCIAKGAHALVVISAGFSETGPEGRARETELLAMVRAAGVRLVGPNCMGIINTDPAVRMNATFAPVEPPVGRVAFSTQSGALGLAILDYARQLHIGLSTFVSVGNKADVSGNDLIEYWEQDPRTDVILLYLESFGNPRKFTQIARRVARTKPIVAVKAGRSRAGARAASSHTGALASNDAVVDALFRQSGVIRTRTVEELFDVAALLANQPVPSGRRVAVLTNAGGPGILAADACEAEGLTLPPPSDATIATLRAILPASASLTNPIDMIASASAAQYEEALVALLCDERIDSVLVIFIPPLVTKGEDVARAIHSATQRCPGKPVAAIFISTDPAPPMLAPVPCYRFPEAASVALARAAAYGEWRETPEGTVPIFDDIDRQTVRAVIDRAVSQGGGWLTPDDAQTVIAAMRIPVVASATAFSEDEAVREADRIGYPVALKAAGPSIVHKTEVGGVRLSLGSATEVRQAWREMTGRIGPAMTSGVVQEMVTGGVEILLGAVEDPTFGPVLACATGGTMTEVLADSQCRLHPLTDRDAAEMMHAMRGAVLLRGYRGATPADEASLREALLRLSALVELCPEIRELDINPLVVLPKGVRALDARIRVR